MMYEIRRLLRGAFLAVAIAIGGALLSVAPGQAVPSDGCHTITAGSPDGDVKCGYCEMGDSGEYIGICENGTALFFACDE